MADISARSPRFWETVSEHVTAEVERARNQNGDERTSVIVYLRDLETVARRECQCRDTIQIIASGRHLLGDRGDFRPADAAPVRSRRFSKARNSRRELNLYE